MAAAFKDEAFRAICYHYGEGAEIHPAFYVNEYEVNQGWGGPEEGGWWYPMGVFIQSHGEFRTRAEAEAFVDSLKDYIQERRAGQHEPHSVLCRGWTSVRVQVWPGSDFPNHRPYYS